MLVLIELAQSLVLDCKTTIKTMNRPKSNFIVILFGLLVFIIWLCYAYYLSGYNLSPNEFGDAFGSLNTLFAGFGLIGVAITLFLQTRELHQAIEEMKSSTIAQEASMKELKSQRKVMEDQREVMEDQRDSAQLTSQVEILRRYQEKGALDVKESTAIDSVIHSIALKILRLETFEQMLRPKLITEKSRQLKLGKGEKYHYLINLTADESSFPFEVEEHCDESVELVNQTEFERAKSNFKYRLLMLKVLDTSKEEFRITFNLTSKRDKSHWQQTLTITPTGDPNDPSTSFDFVHHISEPKKLDLEQLKAIMP